MSDSIIERLRHHAKDERNTAFARSTMREAEGDIARLERKLEQEQISNARAMSGLADAVLKLRAELAASREREARMQWRPIETAPRDGTMVLLAGGLAAPSDWRIKIGYWASEDGAWYIFGGSWRPTRWMPLDGLYAALAEGAQG